MPPSKQYPKDEVQFRKTKDGATIPLHDGKPVPGTEAAKGIAESDHTSKPDRKAINAVKRTPLTSTRPDTTRYQALLAHHEGNHKEAAKSYFREVLQGHYVTREINGKSVDIHFTGSSWQELKKGIDKDTIKARLIPFLPEIIQHGEHSVTTEHHHHDDVKAIHSFKAVVSGIVVIADVKEFMTSDPDHVEYSLTHGLSRQYKDRNAKDKKIGGSLTPPSGPNRIMRKGTAVDEKIPSSFEIVNIQIVPIRPDVKYSGPFSGLNRIHHEVR